MTSDKIEQLKRERQRDIKKKKSQKRYFYLVLCLSILFLIFLYFNNKTNMIFWVIGILLGLVMQRSRFCFAASFRDPIMVGSTSLFRAVLLGLIVSTVFFGMIQYNHIVQFSFENVPGQIRILGLNTVIGAIIFGIGMVIAGGCVSGAMVRVGEGSLMQVVSLVGIMLGAVLGSYQFKFWDDNFISKGKEIYLPEYFGFFPAIIGQIVFLIILYYLAKKYDDKNNIMSDM